MAPSGQDAAGGTGPGMERDCVAGFLAAWWQFLNIDRVSTRNHSDAAQLNRCQCLRASVIQKSTKGNRKRLRALLPFPRPAAFTYHVALTTAGQAVSVPDLDGQPDRPAPHCEQEDN
ncbi:hypothetical protein GCM10018793_01630 [Streptomyces sulfonofaciens]|uniref:Uncharacterized protein n=1 Tax=Streptomyces sulfonofaciens TaxID=68272 RepID=A0A919FNA1_9ACTN|nr:hypothetical protein GCM10018793_01630 [Streptomyces sulfonofaciens]